MLSLLLDPHMPSSKRSPQLGLEIHQSWRILRVTQHEGSASKLRHNDQGKHQTAWHVGLGSALSHGQDTRRDSKTSAQHMPSPVLSSVRMIESVRSGDDLYAVIGLVDDTQTGRKYA